MGFSICLMTQIANHPLTKRDHRRSPETKRNPRTSRQPKDVASVIENRTDQSK